MWRMPNLGPVIFEIIMEKDISMIDVNSEQKIYKHFSDIVVSLRISEGHKAFKRDNLLPLILEAVDKTLKYCEENNFLGDGQDFMSSITEFVVGLPTYLQNQCCLVEESVFCLSQREYKQLIVNNAVFIDIVKHQPKIQKFTIF